MPGRSGKHILTLRLLLDNILIYSGASLLKPSRVETAHRHSKIVRLVEMLPKLL